MATSAYQRKSANERTIEDLHKEVEDWDKKIHVCTDEMLFLMQFLSSDVFEEEQMNFYENLNSFAIELEDIKTDKLDIQLAIRNHKNDLNGMLECEDISCDMFYISQHQKIRNQIHDMLSKYEKFKLKVFRFTTPHLRKIK